MEGMRRAVEAVAARLEEHNALEEERVYSWTRQLMPGEEAQLAVDLRRELTNLPPCFNLDKAALESRLMQNHARPTSLRAGKRLLKELAHNLLLELMLNGDGVGSRKPEVVPFIPLLWQRSMRTSVCTCPGNKGFERKAVAPAAKLSFIKVKDCSEVIRITGILINRFSVLI